MPRSIMGLSLLFAGTTVLSAQSSGAFEITGFGRYTFYDDTLRLDDKFGGGGSLGLFLLKNLAIEAEAAYTSTDGPFGLSISNTPLRGRLTYHKPLGDNATSIRLGPAMYTTGTGRMWTSTRTALPVSPGFGWA